MTDPSEDLPPAPAESIALRAFGALECVVAAATPLSLDEITSALGLPKPSVYRILNLLKGAGLLHRDPATKRFSVGPRLTAFAVDLWRNASLRLQWHRALETAVAEIGESCNLTVRENDRVLYIDRVETRHPLRLHLEVGTRVPLHCTASGKLFLSQLSLAEMRGLIGPGPYERFTPTTITTEERLVRELERTRRDQVGVHDSELFADSIAIAVPIADASGRYFAAMAMHAPASRATLATAREALPALQRAAEAIASTLGSRPSVTEALALPGTAERSGGTSRAPAGKPVPSGRSARPGPRRQGAAS